MRRHVTRLLLLILAGAISLPVFAAKDVKKVGNLYKWTDKDGQVHYSDAPPPEAAKAHREVLNDQGVPVKQLDAQKTPEQLAAEKKAAEAAKQAEARRTAQQQEDRNLLAVYNSVDDIKKVRDARLAAIDSQIRVIEGNISSVQDRAVDLEKRVNQFASQDKRVPPQLQENLDNAKSELLSQQKSLLARKQERKDIESQFAADIDRFKELKAAQEKAEAAQKAASN